MLKWLKCATLLLLDGSTKIQTRYRLYIEAFNLATDWAFLKQHIRLKVLANILRASLKIRPHYARPPKMLRSAAAQNRGESKTWQILPHLSLQAFQGRGLPIQFRTKHEGPVFRCRSGWPVGPILLRGIRTSSREKLCPILVSSSPKRLIVTKC